MASNKINPMVVDLSHHNAVDDLKAAWNFGIRGIIYKATEGQTYVDPTYAKVRAKALELGFLWGAYHFFRPGDIRKQVLHFIKTAGPDQTTLLALDHEDAGCSAADAETFLRTLEALTGRKPVIYTGHLIKDQMKNQVNEYFAGCRLWLAQYGATATCQASWDDWWLWQYTGDGNGPMPRIVPGLGVGKEGTPIDVNSFLGTVEELAAQWSGVPAGAYMPSQVQITKWVQASLNLLGASPALVVDGGYGNKTREAVGKYQVDNELQISGLPDPGTVESLCGDILLWNSRRVK